MEDAKAYFAPEETRNRELRFAESRVFSPVSYS